MSFSTCDSITRAKWLPVSDHPLEELHRKFWGQGVQDWPGNESMDVDEDEDAGYEGDEIGPRTGILDIGIQNLEQSKLWIRKDYFRLYEYCNKYLESSREHMPPSVVITGQPGVGKCFTSLFVIVRLLKYLA
jgi:hypothetical protein